MNTSTPRRRRYATRAAAFVTSAAVVFGAAACGSETASEISQQPAAPAGSVAPKAKPNSATSADAQERRAKAERIEQYRRHYGVEVPNEPRNSRRGSLNATDTP